MISGSERVKACYRKPLLKKQVKLSCRLISGLLRVFPDPLNL